MLRHLRLAALSAHDESIPTVDAGRVAALSVRKRKSDKGLLLKKKSERQASIANVRHLSIPWAYAQTW